MDVDIRMYYLAVLFKVARESSSLMNAYLGLTHAFSSPLSLWHPLPLPKRTHLQTQDGVICRRTPKTHSS